MSVTLIMLKRLYLIIHHIYTDINPDWSDRQITIFSLTHFN